jgi:multidrug efflux pump subunit AcrA (membrane-fusion protein)
LEALLLSGWAFALSGRLQKGTALQQQGPLPVNVVTAVEKVVSEWDEFTGRIEAVESVDIHARVSGYIQSVNFKAGALVEKGDLLFVIDPRPYQADLDRAQADVERAEAQMKLAQIDYTRAEDLRKKSTIFRGRIRPERPLRCARQRPQRDRPRRPGIQQP